MMDDIDTRIAKSNADLQSAHEKRLARVAGELDDRSADIEAIISRLSWFEVAQPTWGLGTGGTRFARFPGRGEPGTIHEKLADAAVVQRLSACCGAVSPHLPWDANDDYGALRDEAGAFGLRFDAVNSNTFQDQGDQRHSYKFGSLSHTDETVRQQAIEHNLDCIAAGRALGSKALTVWVADGSNFPGQSDLAGSFERYLDSMKAIYAALPEDWIMLIEHKMFEPAFYSTVISDWGSSLLAAQALGPSARCLIDLGHHAPNTNIEQIVARLDFASRLGGFHFNDSKYGDDDLDAGSIDPFQLFLVFNELVEAEMRASEPSKPAYMLDQSHNVTDPIESLAISADTLLNTFARALLVNRDRLHAAQFANNVIVARQELTDAYQVDTRPIVAEVRRRAGAAIDPILAYRALDYRERVAPQRKAHKSSGGGIV